MAGSLVTPINWGLLARTAAMEAGHFLGVDNHPVSHEELVQLMNRRYEELFGGRWPNQGVLRFRLGRVLNRAGANGVAYFALAGPPDQYGIQFYYANLGIVPPNFVVDPNAIDYTIDDVVDESIVAKIDRVFKMEEDGTWKTPKQLRLAMVRNQMRKVPVLTSVRRTLDIFSDKPMNAPPIFYRKRMVAGSMRLVEYQKI